MRFGKEPKIRNPPKIEIEQIRTRVDAARCAVQLEIVALIFLHKTSGRYHLEHIATQAVLYALAYVGLLLPRR